MRWLLEVERRGPLGLVVERRIFVLARDDRHVGLGQVDDLSLLAIFSGRIVALEDLRPALRRLISLLGLLEVHLAQAIVVTEDDHKLSLSIALYDFVDGGGQVVLDIRRLVRGLGDLDLLSVFLGRLFDGCRRCSWGRSGGFISRGGGRSRSRLDVVESESVGVAQKGCNAYR